ncbi:protein-disulfide reductase DsbD [Bdellovibrio bacteriovorus]|uniref:protein-disulfide reductase DsbD family protein n=1 Tax=Bdellovibrio bacteriovorus TaxID=959 RepID=UPI0021CEE250|nr:protein-disulfide reductase DsbD [Bdellovibrio bacteriovorus]UXR64384.1 protein-disulfide reductase DsbD [Bdellovibrio bacteriovorus]
MRFSLFYVVVLILSLFASPKSWAADPNDTDPLLAETKVLPYEWSPGQGGSIEIKMKLPAGYHAYEDKFSVVILEPDGFKVAPFKIEPLITWNDKFSKKMRSGMENEATLTAHIEAPHRFLKRHTKMKMELTYQACSDQFCLFPTVKALEVPITVTQVEGESQIMEADVQPTVAPTSFFGTDNFQKYLSSSMWAGLIFVFFAGIFTSFTPCIFPMIPITLAVLGNHSNERTRLQNFFTSCVYVLGIATTYSLLGLVAASSGGIFGASLGNPYVLSVICVIFLAMALSMYGLYDLQVPAFLRNKFGRGTQKKGIVGVYLTGLFAGIVASPCVGPVLVAILTYVASTQNKMLGFIYLFVYALGLGLIFIALGLFNQLAKALPRSGAWMNAFKFILGTLMLSAFYYYLELLLPDRWFDGALAVGLIVLASVYGAFLTTKGKSTLQHIQKGLMQSVLVVGIGYMVIAAFDLRPYIRSQMMGTASINQIQKLNWQPYSEALLAQAAKDQKPVIIDFWADWCAACHELEEQTFTDARVRALSEKFVMLKFDATKDSAELKELKKKYNIQGLPTVVFINPHGMWIDALTLTQFEKAPDFVKRMEKAIQ